MAHTHTVSRCCQPAAHFHKKNGGAPLWLIYARDAFLGGQRTFWNKDQHLLSRSTRATAGKNLQFSFVAVFCRRNIFFENQSWKRIGTLCLSTTKISRFGGRFYPTKLSFGHSSLPGNSRRCCVQGSTTCRAEVPSPAHPFSIRVVSFFHSERWMLKYRVSANLLP